MPLPSLNIFEKLRGIYTPVTDVRRRILAEIAKMIVENKSPTFIETIPYLIIDKNTPTYRDCVFKERAIVRERVRLAFGMDLKEFGAHAPIIDEIAPAMVPHKIIKTPIVNNIKIGCERCPEKSYFVSNVCMGCVAHPCVSVCPKSAVTLINGKSYIDQELCIKCGRCAQVCPYNAICFRERPCAAACGVDAIHSDAEGFAEIDYNKCVSCGMCIVSCPFGAIAEKSEIVQVLLALKKSNHVYAEIAPSFVGQFGPLVKPEMMFGALKQLGFKGIMEVAYGADVAVIEETEELLKIINRPKDANAEGDRQFVGTSCCPAWVMAAKQNYPELNVNISDSYTPMVATAKKIKELDPDAMVVFIGPCIAKKTECFRPEVAKYVDFVITFEELAALFHAYGVDYGKISEIKPLEDASVLGRSFPVATGVANAVINNAQKSLGKKLELSIQTADTLKDCISLLKKIKAKQFQPMPLLVEGMACPYGCVGGPGTLAPLKRAQLDAQKFAKQAKYQFPEDAIK